MRARATHPTWSARKEIGTRRDGFPSTAITRRTWADDQRINDAVAPTSHPMSAISISRGRSACARGGTRVSSSEPECRDTKRAFIADVGEAQPTKPRAGISSRPAGRAAARAAAKIMWARFSVAPKELPTDAGKCVLSFSKRFDVSRKAALPRSCTVVAARCELSPLLHSPLNSTVLSETQRCSSSS